MVRDPVQSLVEAPLLPSSATAMRPLRVGMIGIGTVGAGTFRVLARNQALIAARAGRGIKLVVVCARSLARAMGVVGKDVALTNDPMQVATHPGPQLRHPVPTQHRHRPRHLSPAGFAARPWLLTPGDSPWPPRHDPARTARPELMQQHEPAASYEWLQLVLTRQRYRSVPCHR